MRKSDPNVGYMSTRFAHRGVLADRKIWGMVDMGKEYDGETINQLSINPGSVLGKGNGAGKMKHLENTFGWTRVVGNILIKETYD